MLNVIINPGSGPVADATETEAAQNIRHLLTDCDLQGVHSVRVPDLDYGEGRFAFLLWKDRTCHEIQMPGLPLEQVRFVASPGQNAWHFPRLYVDEASWLWKYAVNILKAWDE